MDLDLELGSVRSCQLQVLHAPHSGANEVENALKRSGRGKINRSECFGLPSETSASECE